jgi:hypothetical protein
MDDVARIDQEFSIDKGDLSLLSEKEYGMTLFRAQMAELVDALASGASERKLVEVRVFFWAPPLMRVCPSNSFKIFQ